MQPGKMVEEAAYREAPQDAVTEFHNCFFQKVNIFIY